MFDLLIPIMVFLTVVLLGGGIVLAMAARRRRLRTRLGPAEASSEGPATAPLPITVRATSRLGGMLSAGRVSARLKEQLARAGYYRQTAASSYLGGKLFLLLLGAVGAAGVLLAVDLSIVVEIYIIAMAAVVCYFLPNLFIRMKWRGRLKEIRNHLPDAVDLLEVCVSAGMGLDMAWMSISAEIRGVCPTLADEMTLVDLEVQLGAPRTEAMRNMAKRTGANELGSLVALLVQSERFGTSVANALRIFAASGRESRSARAEMAAEKLSVKLVFPMVFFIFPPMIIVMVGPAGMSIYQVLIQG